MVIPLSQRDERWKDIKLGTSTNTTIGSHGCTITCLTMLANHFGYSFTPQEVNDRLKSVNGFAQTNLIIWSKIQEAIPGLVFEWRGYEYDNEKVTDNIPCMIEVDGSRIGGTKHWVLYSGNQQMADPWFGNIKATGYYKATGYAIIKYEGTEMPDQTEEINKLKEKLEWYHREFPLEQERLTECRTDREDQRKRVIALEESLEEQEQDNKDLIEQLRELEAKSTTLESNFLAMERELKEYYQKVNELNDTIDKLKSDDPLSGYSRWQLLKISLFGRK